MSPAGFEPALPKETDLESVALDHSAIGAYQNALWRFYEVLLTSSNKSVNCWKHSWNDIVPVKKLFHKSVHRAGFEPASPKREQLKCSALDHSAIDAKIVLPAGFEPATLRLKVWCSTDWAKGALLLTNTEAANGAYARRHRIGDFCLSRVSVCLSSLSIVFPNCHQNSIFSRSNRNLIRVGIF